MMARSTAENGAAAGGADPSGRVSGPPLDAGRGLLTLRLGDARFGLWVDEVLEVIRTPPISRLPLQHREVAGVTGVRGDVVPVLDLGLRLLDHPAVRPGRLVLVRHPESGSVVGLLVDAVETLVSATEDEVQDPPPAAEAALPPELTTGVVVHDDGVVTILHLGRACAPPETTRERVEGT